MTVRQRLNGNLKYFLTVIGIILSIATIVLASYRNYNKIEFVSEENKQKNVAQDKKLSTVCDRVGTIEKDLSLEVSRSTMKDEELEKILLEFKAEFKEIKSELKEINKTLIKKYR